MPKLQHTALYIVLALLLFGCGQNFKSEDFYCMGTFVSINLPDKKFELATDARALMAKLEGEVDAATKKANQSENFRFTGDMEHLYKKGMQFTDMTDGRFSMFAFTVGRLYGFPEGPYHMPSQEQIDRAVKDIKDKKDIKMDLGAFAKGYIVDRAVAMLKKNGVKDALVNAGGDLYALGDKGDRKWRVAVQHPVKKDGFISIVSLKNIALATSGDYERFFMNKEGKRIFHIFDATTGVNPPFYRSVSVIAKDTETADGLATVFFLLPEKEIAEKCAELKTPVLLYTRGQKLIKLCGWEKFEDN